MIDIRELEYKSLQYRQKKNQDQAEINVPLSIIETSDEQHPAPVEKIIDLVGTRPWIEFVANVRKKKIKYKRCGIDFKPTGMWTSECSLCKTNWFSAKDVSIKKLARNPMMNTHQLGQMYQDHGSKISIHQQCAWYAAGKDMVQGDDLEIYFDVHHSVKRLHRYKLTAIQECIKLHKKRKCNFCGNYGATSECGNGKCRGKAGWYHLPCGLRNGTVQTRESTFCIKHGQAKKKKLPALQRKPRKRKQLLSSQGSNPSSQASDYQSEERQQDSFMYHRLNKRLEPIVENPQLEIEDGNDEENPETDLSYEEPGELEEIVMKFEEEQKKHTAEADANENIPVPTIMDTVSLAEAGDHVNDLSNSDADSNADLNTDSNVDLSVELNGESPLSFRIQTIVKPENLENKSDILGDADENSNTTTEKTKLKLKIDSMSLLLKSQEKQNELLEIEKEELQKKIETQETNHAKLLVQYKKTREENKLLKDKNEAQETNYAKLLSQHEKTVEENKSLQYKNDDLLENNRKLFDFIQNTFKNRGKEEEEFNQMVRQENCGDVNVEFQSKKRKIND